MKHILFTFFILACNSVSSSGQTELPMPSPSSNPSHQTTAILSGKYLTTPEIAERSQHLLPDSAGSGHNIHPWSDYRRSGLFPMREERLVLLLEGSRKSYNHLAGYYMAHAALGWQPDPKLSITGGVLLMKQFTNRSTYAMDRFGARFSVTYALTERIAASLWGQYITEAPIKSKADFLLPQTETGAAVNFRVGKSSHLGVEARYQYDDQKRHWDYQSGGKLQVQF